MEHHVNVVSGPAGVFILFQCILLNKRLGDCLFYAKSLRLRAIDYSELLFLSKNRGGV